ncbi:MAG: GTPase HflX [Gemmatimonadota bacterium]|nr:GTPase HflX [Gemmatimonadota bacterium]
MTEESTRERAVLVGAPPRDMSQDVVDEHLEELARLADTAGASVRGSVVQRLAAPVASTYIGRGKVDQLRRFMAEHDATLAVFDEELTPAQGSNLEKALGARVIDRTELILDIFALRARSAEARLQVELAQLYYLRPRLKRMWTHLSRIGGGIGARGPGEQQIETDRRLIDRRIARLRRQLDQIASSRETQRKSRDRAFTIALVGYTNAGKSSILRELSGSDVFVEDRLFATLDSATRVCELGQGLQVLLTDTVGFIRKLPHHLVASFRATLEEVVEADLLLHVVDASSPSWEEQIDAVEDVLRDAGAGERPAILVLNKIDRVTHAEERALRERVGALMGPHVFSSVFEEGGVDALREAIREAVRSTLETVRISIPAADGRTVAEAYREGEVLAEEVVSGRVVLVARVPVDVAGRWRATSGLLVEEGDAA